MTGWMEKEAGKKKGRRERRKKNKKERKRKGRKEKRNRPRHFQVTTFKKHAFRGRMVTSYAKHCLWECKLRKTFWRAIWSHYQNFNYIQALITARSWFYRNICTKTHRYVHNAIQCNTVITKKNGGIMERCLYIVLSLKKEAIASKRKHARIFLKR